MIKSWEIALNNFLLRSQGRKKQEGGIHTYDAHSVSCYEDVFTFHLVDVKIELRKFPQLLALFCSFQSYQGIFILSFSHSPSFSSHHIFFLSILLAHLLLSYCSKWLYDYLDITILIIFTSYSRVSEVKKAGNRVKRQC